MCECSVNVSPRLEGGQLKFRPESVPSAGYWEDNTDVVADVSSGSAVVFRNMPHRHRRIVNAGNSTEGRLFVAFFIAGAPLM